MLQMGSVCTAWDKGGSLDAVEQRLYSAEQKITDTAITNVLNKTSTQNQKQMDKSLQKGMQLNLKFNKQQTIFSLSLRKAVDIIYFQTVVLKKEQVIGVHTLIIALLVGVLELLHLLENGDFQTLA